MMKPELFRPHVMNGPRNPECCNATVYDRWRIDVVGSQCSRKASVHIDGVGFCKQHAKRYQHKVAVP